MANQINNSNEYQRREYISRMNKVLDYIDLHLIEKLPLAKLAEVSNFSPFHFHRIFKALIGETINQYIQRLRIEKAARMLLDNPYASVTEIALDSGFSGSATFARVFKEFYSMSATEWREGGYKEFSKNRKADNNISQADSKTGDNQSKISKALEDPGYYIATEFKVKSNQYYWKVKMKDSPKLEAKVEIKEFEDFQVAYVRHIGPYKGDSDLFGRLFGQLMTWAGPRGLMGPNTKCLSVYHDNPELTEDEKLRLSVCLECDESTEVGGEIGKMEIQGGKYAVAHFELDPDQYEAAWNTVYGSWLPNSGFQPDDKPYLEFYLNNPQEHPEGKHIVDICVPVKPM